MRVIDEYVIKYVHIDFSGENTDKLKRNKN